MPETPSAYPLTWPAGWPRTRSRQTPPFRTVRVAETAAGFKERDTKEISLVDARERLADELDKLHARGVVLSTNLELRVDGQIRANGQAPADPGAAVYFTLSGKPVALACDKWNTVAGNVAALAAHIGAMRGMDRWGVGRVEQLFAGYLALPAPMVVDNWREVLLEPASLEAAETVYRAKMRTAHPDAGGTEAAAARLNAAIAAARRHFGGAA